MSAVCPVEWASLSLADLGRMRTGRRGGVTKMRDRGQSSHRANTVGHSRSKMRHEISGCLKRIGSSPLGHVCYVSSDPMWLCNAAALGSESSLTAVSLISTNGHQRPLHSVSLFFKCMCGLFHFCSHNSQVEFTVSSCIQYLL